ncbi:PQQ-like beta-propeller repeat protein [Alphaproteobacteria bacterium]|nr:PQQ-like beta-propeller repeat protein [Alphaproteobacteria bacterium]
MIIILKNTLLYLIILLVLTNCSSIKKLDFLGISSDDKITKIEGKRLSISISQKELKVNKEASQTPITLEDPLNNLVWSNKGKNNYAAPENLFINKNIKVLWKKDIGDGSGSYNKIFAQPVGNKDFLFVLDAEGKIVCVNIKNGDIIWESDIFPDAESINTNIDGGLALSENDLIASTSYGEIIKLNSKDGSIVWKKNISAPVQGAPSIFNNFIYQMTIANELFVIDINTGNEIWRYDATLVSAVANGAASPIVDSNLVIFPSNTGELIALDAVTGSLLWSTNLVVNGAISGTLELTDIDSGPVMYKGLIYASSLSGKFAVLDSSSGGLIWELPIKTSNNPVINGNAVFILSNDGRLINTSTNNGNIRWIANIYEEIEIDDEGAPLCSAPLLAKNNIWLVCQDGKVFKVNSNDGKYYNIFTLDSPSFISPIVINGTMIFYTEDAEVIAYR